MKKISTLLLFLFLSTSKLIAQDYAQWPADKPETGFIEQSQSRETRLDNGILAQEADMQDKMRTLITDMMENATKNLHWEMIELSEYTNNGGMQSGATPYPLRSPRGIEITFQFIVNNDSLLSWKSYQLDYSKRASDNVTQDYNNMAATQESPLYKRYQDSANHYMNLYSTYLTAHQNEGADLFTKDKHPKYYQDKENEFINKMNALTQQTQDKSGIQQMQDEKEQATRRFRNNTVVQVQFRVNPFVGNAINESSGPIESIAASYPLPKTTLTKFYTIQKDKTSTDLFKWNNSMLILLGNFKTTPTDKYVYSSGFNQGGQGDEHTPKKIKSDKVQNISITINGNKSNIEKLVKFIDVDKLNNTIVKN